MPPLLQPIAHALMQAREEVTALMQHFPDSLLWKRPMGQSWNGLPAQPIASVGFHLQHLTGVLDRLLTYAREEILSPEQLAALTAEESPASALPTVQDLVQRFDEQVERALAQLRSTDEQTLTEFRGVGRAQLPSTVIGLLVHAAEHTMRHVGQLSVTARLVTL
jgi:uncharacterized damage-inducible protein DinB